jgi:hypothetical protein
MPGIMQFFIHYILISPSAKNGVHYISKIYLITGDFAAKTMITKIFYQQYFELYTSKYII